MFFRAVLAFLALPAVVGGLVPWLLLDSDSWKVRGTLLGWPLLVFGAFILMWCVRDFYKIGKGTLAPWDPPSRLVVAGPYRYVRNPMITGVILIIIAESLIFRSLALGEWAAGFLLLNAIHFPLIEEPQLERRFGDDYRRYKRHVGRFIPRIRPWNGA